VGEMMSPLGGAGNIKGSVAKPARWGEFAFPILGDQRFCCLGCGA